MKTYPKQIKINTKKILLTLLLCLVASAQAATEDCCIESTEQVLNSNNLKDKTINLESDLSSKSQPDIYPYINAKMLQDFGTHSKTGMGLDAFVPIVDANTRLFFSNVKLNNYSNKTFDGSVYFGYRHLLPEEQKLYGVYASLDFKKTEDGDYFKQITLGAEYWIHQWFFGYKMFSPIGNSENSYEQAVPGVGAEIGYEFSKKSTVYIEGYYLNTFNTNSVPGVGVKLKQNLFSKATGSGVLDQVDLEIGARKDKLTGNRLFVELSFKIGASSNNSTPDGVAAHMTDTLSRNRIFIEKKPKAEAKLVSAVSSSKPSGRKFIQCFYGYDKDPNQLSPGGDEECPASLSDIRDYALLTPGSEWSKDTTEVRFWYPDGLK